jgi:hypothetical protein
VDDWISQEAPIYIELPCFVKLVQVMVEEILLIA